MPRLTLWHGSREAIARIDPGRTVDGGFHAGTEAQARMRNARVLHEIEVDVRNVRRSRDRGGDWKGRIAAARAAGFDAIVYLNRYEGMSSEVIERLAAAGDLARLDDLTDAAFRKLVPEAEDSWILLDPEAVRIVRIIDRDAAEPAPEEDRPAP
ncbi:hypothetical protein [Defluviimonas salinarum]|uniref:Resolvase/invertase-type recombinase catalytic domain-containing protein n=1 Tax=Defluviimonas salinarum TaxID=2992147 RepID=A0ABT3J7E0_9RHOB|nr:hypothetical protein [Defluviimonas salinarum]MCW3783597.1 hypothetical protein [Defluviimonas salinarum]